DVGRVVGHLQEGEIVFGQIDEDGTFTIDHKYRPVPVPGHRPSTIPSAAKTGREKLWGDESPGRYEVINKPRRANELVYEYRVGNLIKGTLDIEGNFIPELGSEVIPFTDYRYDGEALRIYNLPGKIIPKP